MSVGGRAEWTLTVERGPNRADRERWALEDAKRYQMALQAVIASPVNADEIAREALERE
jgi:hypothetical protein